MSAILRGQRAPQAQAEAPGAARLGARYFLVIASLLAALGFVIIIATAWGSVSIPLKNTACILLNKLPFLSLDAFWLKTQELIITEVRLPRVLVAVIVGGALALCGAVMQGLFRNPMADPSIIGTTSGGALGAILAIYLGWASNHFYALPVASFIGALSVTTLVYMIATEHGKTPVNLLLLSGIAVGGLTTAISSFVLSMALHNFEIAREIIFWSMGGLDGRSWPHVKTAYSIILPASLAILAYGRDLNIMLFGEESAHGLGVNVIWTRRVLLILTSLVTGVSVSVSGAVGFVGLVIPHIMRIFVGPDHRILLPTSFLAGACFLPLADLACRTLIRPEELRLGVVTTCVGGPFFIYLLIKGKKEAKGL